MSTQKPTLHTQITYNGDGSPNLSALAEAFWISRPTLYLAKKQGRLTFDGHWAAYVPAKVGRPKERRDG